MITLTTLTKKTAFLKARAIGRQDDIIMNNLNLEFIDEIGPLVVSD